MIYTISYDEINILDNSTIPIVVSSKINDKKLKKYNKLIMLHDVILENNNGILDKINALDLIEELHDMLDEKAQFFFKMVNCPPWSQDSYNIALVYDKDEKAFCDNLISFLGCKGFVSIKEYNEDIKVEFFKKRVVSEMLYQGAKQEDLDLIKDATIRNAIKNNRSPKDVAWAILQ